MKIPKKLEPLIAGFAASIIIGVLSYLSFETSTGFWLMFSFGSTTLIVLIFYERHWDWVSRHMSKNLAKDLLIN